MEDESRPLPHGWVRQFDPKSEHQFFVDTNAKPPRSIWHHPYDDDTYLSGLPAEEREHIEDLKREPSRADIISMSSVEDFPQDSKTSKGSKGPKIGSSGTNAAGGAVAGASASSASTQAPGANPAQAKGLRKFGRSLKDKLTGTTHEQRETERRERDIQEQREYEMHQRVRAAMARAMETGQPQLIGKDRNGKDVFIEPPTYGAGLGYGASGYPNNGYSYNPYQNGPYYHNPNAVYVRPDYPYNRPYGGGYGGGYGLPILGGLMGGALLGGLLF